MKIYFIRHAIAEERREDLEESDRKLTKAGKEKMERIAENLSEALPPFETLLSSPWTRARETADILVEHGLAAKVGAAPFATPDKPDEEQMASLLRWIEKERKGGHKSIALVGHSPVLEKWAECLIFGTPAERIVLRKGGVVGLRLPESGNPVGKSELIALLSPRLILDMG